MSIRARLWVVALVSALVAALVPAAASAGNGTYWDNPGTSHYMGTMYTKVNTPYNDYTTWWGEERRNVYNAYAKAYWSGSSTYKPDAIKVQQVYTFSGVSIAVGIKGPVFSNVTAGCETDWDWGTSWYAESYVVGDACQGRSLVILWGGRGYGKGGFKWGGTTIYPETAYDYDSWPA